MKSKVCHCGCGLELTGKQTKWASKSCLKIGQRRAWLQRVYAITLDEYDVIWNHQGGLCPICTKPLGVKSTPHIDHEHGGHVRGICCAYCNTRLIGRLKNHETAQRLADYLKNPPAVVALGEYRAAPGRPPKKRQPRKRVRGV